MAFVTLWSLAEWPYGPIFLFQEFWEFDQDITFFDFETKRGVSIFFLVLKQDPLLIKYPTLEVREHLTSLPPLSPHKNLDSLLVSGRPFPRLSRLHVETGLMGQFGLSGRIPWLRNWDGAFCFVCKQDVESVTNFLLDCSYFKQNFLSPWRNLKIKITVSNQADGVKICQFIDNSDRVIIRYFCF